MRSLLFGILLLVVSAPASLAMRFTFQPPAAPGGAGILAASGKVELGDEERLRTALKALPPDVRLAGLSLDSPGGDLLEGLRVATAVRDLGLQTMVGQGAMCASACFNIFAAGSRRFASTGAQIGVHSASYRGSEEIYAQAMTVKSARQLAEFGVPDAILGKMISAPADQMWWLNRADLEAMRAEFSIK